MARKSAIKIIEDDVHKIEKSIGRNKKRIFITIAAAAVIVFFILFVTGLRVRFALQDDLIINLEPPDKSFTIKNNQEQGITFHISADNSVFCTANCSYVLYDRSEEKIIDSGTASLRNKGEIELDYELAPYRSGSGQKIYNLDIKCQNIKSFFCSTYSPIRKKSAFITLNYELTEEEGILKAELKQGITKGFSLINNASRDLQRSDYILNETNELIGSGQLHDNYSAVSADLNDLIEETCVISDLWAKEKYTALNSLYGKLLISESSSLSAKSRALLSSILSSINKQNELAIMYNQLKEELFSTAESQKRHIYYSPSKEGIDEKFYAAYGYLNSTKLKLSDKDYSHLSGFEKDLLQLSILIEEFNETITQNYEEIAAKGKNLSLLEYSKKCYLGYCENLTGYMCADLSKIFLEYGNNTYQTEKNISEIPYYEGTAEGVRITLSNESREFYEKFCLSEVNISYPNNISDISGLNPIDINNISTTEPIQSELAENLPLCCIYGRCAPCCTTEECQTNSSLFPVVLIHGHSLLRGTSPEPVLDSLNKIQYQLQEDSYVNAGTMRFDFNLSDYRENEWGMSGSPITIKASYYYDYFYSLGKYIYITRSTDNIDTYSIRLNEIINVIKFRTGKPKVNIIAHSMGGLVARRYLQIFGDDSVDKLILIATPNKGIEGNIKQLCQVFGEKRECEDMYDDGIFIKKLNDPNYKLHKAKLYTISGKGCKTADKEGDGVVTFESSLIDYAESYVINGVCSDVLKRELHSNLPDIDKYPEVYEDIREILNINQ